jgi:hypothetical protein
MRRLMGDLADFSRQYTALVFCDAKPEKFRPDFREWLVGNWAVYQEFERRALRLWHSHRRHYGARCIWETIRYDTAVGELPKGEFKLNNVFAPDCARLFMLLNPRCSGIFETRVNPLSVRAA